MRTHVMTRLSACIVTAALLGSATTADAQWFVGSGNNRIGSIGDAPTSLFRAKVRTFHHLNLSTLGLFGDSEVFPVFNPENLPAPFIFALPNYAGAGHDFTDVTFDEYLDFAARSYGLSGAEEYTAFFRNQNPNTVHGRFLFEEFDGALDQFNALLQQQIDSYGDLSQYSPEVLALLEQNYFEYRDNLINDYEDAAFRILHEDDFVAGGGFLTFGEPFVPTPREPEPEPEPFVPFFEPLDPVVTAEDIAAATADAVSGSGSGSTAANVSVVPEPATLGLLTLGAGAVLLRRR